MLVSMLVPGSSTNTWVFRSSGDSNLITPCVCQRIGPRIESKDFWLSMKESMFLYSVSSTIEFWSHTLWLGLASPAFEMR